MNVLLLTRAIEAAHWLKHRSMQASFLSEDSLLHLRPQVAMQVCLLSSKAGSTTGSTPESPSSPSVSVPVSVLASGSVTVSPPVVSSVVPV